MQAAVPLACFLSMIRPPGIQFENSLLQIAPVEKAKCPYVKDHNDIEFRLYTRHNPTVYQELYIDDDEKLFASNLDYHAPTVLYFHAFMENPDDGSAAMVREAYVLRGDTNIIMVDASRLEAGPWYFTAAENTWYIGKFAARFVDYLVTRGLNLNNTHFVGHSLGAQAAGVAGSALTTGRVSRITGLDPALPLFHGLPLEQRLDRSDAEFVDVIHTDAGIFGVNKPVGHADFYPNGGISPQPGCELEVVIPQQMLLNKCDPNTQPHGFYTFELSPNRITKNSQILERRLQKFFTQIQGLKSVAEITRPVKFDTKGQMFLTIASRESLKKRKLDHQENIETRLLNHQGSMGTKWLDLQGYETNKINSQGNNKTRIQNAHRSLKSSIPDTQEKLEIRNENNQKSIKLRNLDPRENHKASVNNPQKTLESSTFYPKEIITPKILDYTENTKLQKPDSEPSTYPKISLDSQTSQGLESLIGLQESLNKRNLGPHRSLNANDDQVMVESIKTYHVLKPDFVTKNQNNFGQTTDLDSQEQNQSQTDSDYPHQSETDLNSKKQSQIESTGHRNHVVKRQKRFLNLFKQSETEQQDNFLFKLLNFAFTHRKGIPVYSVMREINTLVKSAQGELNHISKERNNYIGAALPPTLIPTTYTLELGNENKLTAFVKKLLGLAPKGDRLTINGK